MPPRPRARQFEEVGEQPIPAPGGTIEESLKDVIAQIEAAFTDAPRPADADLLHPECRDDMDLQRLREFDHRRER